MFSGAEPFSNFGSGHYFEHSCEIIYNLDQWLRRRCRLKKKFVHDARHTTHDGQQTKTNHNN